MASIRNFVQSWIITFSFLRNEMSKFPAVH